MRCCDLFAGAGGMSLGAEQAGVEVTLAVELHPSAAETHRANFPDCEVKECDASTLSGSALGRPGSMNLVCGGVPCSGFSTSNRRTRSAANLSNWLFGSFLKLAFAARPDWILFENVHGFTETEEGFFLGELTARMEAEKYAASRWVLNAVDFGVPQRRRRIFVVGSRRGLRPQPPVPTHSKENRVCVEAALGDLPELQNGAAEDFLDYRPYAVPSVYAAAMRGDLRECGGHLVTRSADRIIERYRHVPPGGNWEDIPSELMDNYADRSRCHTGIYHRLHPDRPSVVIGNYRKNMLIHSREHRGLSVREAARLQSFPDHFNFTGSIGFQQQQVANAAPPLLVEAVVRQIVRAEEGKAT